jgi:hypothetical protein
MTVGDSLSQKKNLAIQSFYLFSSEFQAVYVPEALFEFPGFYMMFSKPNALAAHL